MGLIIGFLKPSWTKLGWFFIAYMVSQVYLYVIMDIVPFTSLASFVGFLLNPATIALESMSGVEKQLALPFANTINLIWIYAIAVVLAKEVSRDRE